MGKQHADQRARRLKQKHAPSDEEMRLKKPESSIFDSSETILKALLAIVVIFLMLFSGFMVLF